MSSLCYKHTQSVASSTWTIVHNLGKKPIVDVVININGVNAVVNPISIIHTDDNTLTISFSSPRSGTALLI